MRPRARAIEYYVIGAIYEVISYVKKKNTKVNDFGMSRKFFKTIHDYEKCEIKDGLVTYDCKYLLKKHLTSKCFNEDPDLRKRLRKMGTIKVFHSWCECCTKQGVMIIDYHPNLTIRKLGIKTEILIIGYKDDLPHRYEELTHKVEIGNYLLFFGNFWPKFAHLRT